MEELSSPGMLNALLSLEVFCDVGMNNPAAHAHFRRLRHDMPGDIGADSSATDIGRLDEMGFDIGADNSATDIGHLDEMGFDCGADNSAADLRSRHFGGAGNVRWLD